MSTDRVKVANYYAFDINNPLCVQNLTVLGRKLNNLKIVSEEIDGTALVKFLYNFQKCMEDQFGKQSDKTREVTKLPAFIFQDFSLNGPLHTFLSDAFKILRNKNLSTADMRVDNRELCIAIVKSAEKALIAAGFMSQPVIYFNNLPNETKTALTKIIKSHGGKVTENESLASHVITWNEEVDLFPEELSDHFIRILDLNSSIHGGDIIPNYGPHADKVFVHWWYFPDSYNEWISCTEIDIHDLPEIQSYVSPKRKYNVCCRFIFDLNVFNEWPNEADYENTSSNTESASDFGTVAAGNNVTNYGLGGSPDATTPTTRKSKGRKQNKQASATKSSGVTKEVPVVVPEALIGTDKVLCDLWPASLLVDSMTLRKETPTNTVTMTTDNQDEGEGDTNEPPVTPIVTPVGGEVIGSGFGVRVVPPSAAPTLTIAVPTITQLPYNDIIGNTLHRRNQPLSVLNITAQPVASEPVMQPNGVVLAATPAEPRKAPTVDTYDVKEEDITAAESSAASNETKGETQTPSIEPIYLNKLTPKEEIYTQELLAQITLETYFKIRTAIITLYYLNPTQCLTATECRRKMCGDISIIHEVYDVIHACGLINSAVRFEARNYPILYGDVIKGQYGIVKDTNVTVGDVEVKQDSNWTASLDNTLVTLIQQHGCEWNLIAEHMNNNISNTNTNEPFTPHGCYARLTVLKNISTLDDSDFLAHRKTVEKPKPVSDAETRQARIAELTAIYMENRIKIEKEKSKLLENIENLYELTRIQQDVERSDANIQAVYVANRNIATAVTLQPVVLF